MADPYVAYHQLFDERGKSELWQRTTSGYGYDARVKGRAYGAQLAAEALQTIAEALSICIEWMVANRYSIGRNWRGTSARWDEHSWHSAGAHWSGGNQWWRAGDDRWSERNWRSLGEHWRGSGQPQAHCTWSRSGEDELGIGVVGKSWDDSGQNRRHGDDIDVPKNDEPWPSWQASIELETENRDASRDPREATCNREMRQRAESAEISHGWRSHVTLECEADSTSRPSHWSWRDTEMSEVIQEPHRAHEQHWGE